MSMFQVRHPDDFHYPNSNKKRSRTRSLSPTKDHLLDSSPAGKEGEKTSLLVNISPSADKIRSGSGTLSNKRPRLLKIEIPSALNSGLENSFQRDGQSEQQDDEKNSLFSEDSPFGSLFDGIDGDHGSESAENESKPSYDDDNTLASRICPSVPGLYFDPSVLLPEALADDVFSFCMQTYFTSPADNQVMLFGRYPPPQTPSESRQSGFPLVLLTLLSALSSLLRPVVPPSTHSLLFPDQPSRARQAIINLYQPGEGITPHVDLLGRYGDGIIGVSLSSGSVMRFDKVEYPQEQTSTEDKDDNHAHTHEDPRTRWDIYLPERTIIVLSEDARYKWKHGIDKKRRDFVVTESSSDPALPDSSREQAGTWIDRRVRMSVTFRWLLPGADVVGDGS